MSQSTATESGISVPVDTTFVGTSKTTTAPSSTRTSYSLPHCIPESTPDSAGDDNRQEETDDVQQDDDDESGLFAIDFMFEGSQPSRMEYFTWKLPTSISSATTQQSTAASKAPPPPPSTIQVALSIADDNPGAVQSGHYLWPAAKLLADYLVQQHSSSWGSRSSNSSSSSSLFHHYSAPCSILELGAGCALVSLTALQLWQDSLQCVVVSDHDPGTLERARNNYESTLQKLMDASNDVEQEWMDTINNIGSIPVVFESLAWSCRYDDDDEDAARIRVLLEEHTNAKEDSAADVILGSDLIYDIHVVEPLLTTAARFLSKKKRQPSTAAASSTTSSCSGGVGGGACFLLSQSFAYDNATEQKIDATCQKLGLQRQILWEEQDEKDEHDQEKQVDEDGDDASDMDKKNKSMPSTPLSAMKRIQEFRWVQEEEL
jgi:Lysine methyltransferase